MNRAFRVSVSKFRRAPGGMLLCLLVAGVLSSCVSNAANGDPYDLSTAKWLLLGPLPSDPSSDSGPECTGFRDDLLAGSGGEAAAEPTSGAKAAGSEWKQVSAKDGIIDFNGIFGIRRNAVAYAFTKIDSPESEKIVLKAGSDDGIKVFVNGKQVLSRHAHRAYGPDQDSAVFTLDRGTNRILVKVDQGSGDWMFGVRLVPWDEELAAWEAVKDPGFSMQAVAAAAEPALIRCDFFLEPSFAVEEPIALSVHDESGRIVATAEAVTGSSSSLSVQGVSGGFLKVRAEGKGRLAGKVREAYVIAGDPARTLDGVKNAAGRALATLSAAGYRTGAGSGLKYGESTGEDPAASLEFHLLQMDGKVHPSLVSSERALRSTLEAALLSGRVSSGSWKPGTLLGYHQWAYRSGLDGSLQPYSLYVPRSFDPSKRYPLIVALHGYSGNDYEAGMNLASLEPEDFIIVSCFGRGDTGYRSAGEQDVLDVMGIIEKSYPIDPDRVYLTGWSMGGYGTWNIGQFNADRFAAIAPFCGWTGTGFLENLKNTPVLAVHGDSDPTVPVGMDVSAVERLRSLGYEVRYDELKAVGHDAWGAWIRIPENGRTGGAKLLEYFRAHVRTAWPAQVTVKTDHLLYGSRSWVVVDELENPPGAGQIDASIINSSRIDVSVQGVSAFTLDLAHPSLKNGETIDVRVNGDVVKAVAGRSVSFEGGPRYEAGGGKFRIAGTGGNATRAAVRHTYGGVTDIFRRRPLIVYGTRSNGDVLRATAEALADWSVSPQISIGWRGGKYIVVPDSEVTEADTAGRDLLLIGNELENSVLASMRDAFPVRADGASISVRGKEFPVSKYADSFMIAAFPDPRDRSKLVGIITVPPGYSFRRFVTNFNLNIYGYGVETRSATPRPYPDVMVFENQSQVLYQGWFDRNWEKIYAAE